MIGIYKTIVLLILFLICFKGSSQDIHISSRSEIIKVLEDSTFVNEITINFSYSEEIRVFPIFYDTELENVSDIKLYEQKGKRLKKISSVKIREQEVDLDYITSKKIKSIQIPAEKDIRLIYSVSCKELMYFSRLPFFSYDEIDTLNYEVQIPKEFGFNYNVIYKDSLTLFHLDSIKTKDRNVWRLKVVPKKIIPDPLQFFGIYKNIKVPLMRTLVYPNTYREQPKKYLNDWYIGKLSPQTSLNASAINKIDELTAGVEDKTKIVDILYDYVRNNFKYVAIEIGMGAFIPSHVNEVFVNKQGDCKDLSNFLTAALKYKGIKCDLALAATFDHISDCDFPSLGSANHVICVANIDGEKILLDPTDSVHVEGTPVQSLQGRTILIVNSSGGQFYDVDPFKPEQNEIFYKLDLDIDSSQDLIDGEFRINYNGISGNYLRRLLNSKNEEGYTEILKSFYEEIFGNQVISNFTINKQQERLKFSGDVSVIGKTFGDDNSRYVFFDFLPRLFETEGRETLMSGTFLGNNFSKRMLLKITLDEQIEDFKPINHEFKEEGVSLKFEITSISPKEIELKYNFVFDYVFIDSKNVDLTNKIITEYNSIINEPFVFKKSKN